MKKRIAIFAVLLLLFAVGCTSDPGSTTPPDGDTPQELTVTLDKTSAEMYVGDTITLTAQVNIEGAEIVWSTSSRAVVSFVADGNTATVTAEGLGSAEIRIRHNEQLMAKCSITVVEPPQSLSVRLPQDMLVLHVGGSAVVQAVADDSLTGDISWDITDTSIAEIEYQGLIVRVEALAAGQCTVTVTFGEEQDSFTLIVEA